MNTDRNLTDLDPELAERFAKLREISPRDPKRTSDGRAAYLLHARELMQKKPQPAPISREPQNRLILWTNTLSQAFRIKEMPQMFTKVMAVVIAAVLLFGGFAATAYASQASLPNDALYGVKTFGENVRLSLASQGDDKLGLALEFAQRRVEEIAALKELGIEIPPHVAAQYQEQVEYTLRLAAGLPDEQIVPGLERVRTRLQEQLQRLDQLSQVNPNDPALIQARDRVREQLRLVDDGLGDPQQFRERIRTREQQGPIPSATEQPGPTVTPPAGNQNANTNSNNNANGNGNENTNSNGNGNENANGNQNGNENMNGNNAGFGDGNGNSNDDNGNDNVNDDGGNGNDDGGGGNGNDNGGGGNGNGDDGGGGNDNGGSGGGNDNGGDGNGNDNGGGGNGNENGGDGGNGHS
jgi:uncharacterized membrane protein YgcG